MKIVLVDNMILPEAGSLAAMDVHPHLGLLALAAAAERDGHIVEIIDPKRLVRDGIVHYAAGAYRQVAELILARAPDVVGFTALGCSLLFAVRVAGQLKACKGELPILIGGPHATILHREVLERYPQFDVVVRYEADETFSAVLARLPSRDFDAIAGITWRTDDGTLHETPGAPKIDDLDTLPLTDYDHYPVAALELGLLRIEAGRGCPFACSFCSTAGFFQRSFRLKSAARLVDELDRLYARYGCRDFKLDHDMFTTNKRKVRAFCEAVTGRGYRWSASARVDCVDEALLETMAASGCVNLYFGIETGSPRMQTISAKKLDLTLVEPILARADALGIETTASFITGFPEETDADLDATLDLIGRLMPRASCLTQLHLLAPEPGTPLFSALGVTIRYDGVSGPYHCGLLEAEDEAEIRAAPGLYQTFYHYPSRLARARSIRAVALVELLRRIGAIISAYLLRFFEGRLSHLARAIERFLDADGIAEVDATSLIAFSRTRFGARHHLVSLLRFALMDTSAASPVTAERGFDPTCAYAVPPGLTRLDAIHDCDALLARIRSLPASATLPADPDNATRSYVAVPQDGRMTLYLVDSAISTLLAQFATPLAPHAVVEGLRMTGVAAERARATFAELAAIGLLIRATSRPERVLV
jgi:radical SAM superfamily enzyme YgiQ (UPF0313 family)